MRLLSVLLALGLIVPSTSALAREMITLAPASPWNLDYGEDKCSLIRSFGEDENLTYLMLAMYAPDDTPSLTVVKGEETRKKSFLKTQFAPDTDWTEPSYPLKINYGDAMHGFLFEMSFLPHQMKIAEEERNQEKRKNGDLSSQPAWSEEERDKREKEITQVRIKGAFKDDYALELGDFHVAMASARVCLDDLLNHWGIDAETQRTLSRKVQIASDPSQWLRSRDYPSDMPFARNQGFVNYRLIIDETGKPTDCVVQQTSRPEDFAALTCKLLLRRAEFWPALDAEGKPVISYLSSSVKWVIE